MPLPFIAAAAAGAFAYKYFAKNEDRKNSDSDTSSNTDETRKSLTRDQERDLDFLIRLATSAAHADGEMSKEEECVIQNYINQEVKEYAPSPFLKNLKIEEPCEMTELHRRWEAVKDTDGSWEALIKEVIGADDQCTNCEKAFLFRLNLMLEGVPDQKLFMLTNEESRSTLSLEYVNVDSLPEGFTVNNPLVGEFLIEHPAQIRCKRKELIPLSAFFDDSFLTNQDTELVNAARLAGAKKVTIYSGKKRSESITTNKELKGKASSGMQSGSVANEVGASNTYSSNDKKVVVYEFEGNVTGLMGLLKSKFVAPEKELLRQSTWLKNDPELTEFVRGCFSDNKLTYFRKEISTESQKNIIFSATLAAECKLVKVSADAKSSLEEKGKFYEESEKMYEVAFA